MAAHPTRPYNTFAEMVKTAKAEPGKISVGTLSASLAQIFLAFVQKENGFELNNIPYKGGGPMYQDALGGETDMTLTSLVNMTPHVTAGKLKLIGVTSDKRSKLAPNVATLAEQGIKASPPSPGGASTRRPARPSRSSSACMPRCRRQCARPT